MLNALGLSPAESAVYEALLAHPGRKITALAQHLALSDMAVWAAVSTLVGLSLLQPCPDSPAEFRTVSPHLAFQAILRAREADVARSQHELAEAKAAIAAATAQQQLIGSECTERLVGQDIVQARLEALAAQTSSQWLTVLADGAPQARLSSWKRLDQVILERGGQVRAVFQDSARTDSVTFGYALWLTKMGGQARTTPVLPTRMLISDRRVAMVPINPAAPALGLICTWEPGIVSALTAVFDQAWNEALPLSVHTSRNGRTGLTPEERGLLSLLAAGMTDESAASRLGISLRTARRQMASLMDRLGAASRFQAGAQAARRGWLDRTVMDLPASRPAPRRCPARNLTE